MSGFVKDVKGKITGWLGRAFAAAQPVDPPCTSFNAQQLYALFFQKRLAPINHLTRDYIAAGAQRFCDLLTTSGPKTPEAGLFRLALLELSHKIGQWDDTGPFIVEDRLLITLHEHSAALPATVDRLAQMQQGYNQPSDYFFAQYADSFQHLFDNRTKRELQEDIQAVYAFHNALNKFLAHGDIPHKSDLKAREALYHDDNLYGSPDSPLFQPSKWRV